ncbi:uncharacterized protein LOC130734458 [Lotus japonicus]|uniref:uncharacterized protein LOC130734458 n=1 Tax=Lotus japonicus TaxID=34305 RepID=UPI0025832CC4|nr:uncharacterized protein LOC130734458 [Lotus japonicus]
MTKAVVVIYILVATATLFMIAILSPPVNFNKEGDKDRLNRRFGYKIILERAPKFDPLLTNIDRKEAQNININNAVVPRRLDSTTSASEVAETYQYLISGGTLNTTLRLIILFPLLDRDPKDGVVVFNELEAWITQRAVERLDLLTQAEFDSKDKNGDSAISFQEYLPQFSQHDIERKEMGHGEAGWWMQKFEIADIDFNGLLNFTELRDFLHPEDSKNQQMLKWMITDRVKLMHPENDGKLNFDEFKDHVYNTYSSYMDFETSGGNIPDPEDKFAQLDVNKDQFLTPEELIPIVPYLYPGELAYAKYFTYYLISEADENGDKKLSLEEMLNHEFIFYNTVHADDDPEGEEDHDEL